MWVDHPSPLCMEEVFDTERALVGRQLFRRLQSEIEVPIARLLARECFELHQERGHQIERDPDPGKLTQQRHHAPVVLQGMQPDPREDVLPREQVLVERLMHVPQDGDARHNGSTVRILDRYVIREVLLPLGIALLVFTFILIIPFLIEYAEDFIAKGVSFGVVLRVMATLLPQALALCDAASEGAAPLYATDPA